jgi:protein-tyrosine-phosphatase
LRPSNGFLHSSYDQFAGRATIPNFLPLLAERWARQRVIALARVEGKITDTKPTVLFLCTHNAGRSQMALGYFNHLAGDQGVAWSGGSEPGTEINPAAVAAMAEVGIDITREFPKPWTDEIVQAADVVVTMGCGDACPVFPGKRYEEWVLPDPAGQSVDTDTAAGPGCWAGFARPTKLNPPRAVPHCPPRSRCSRRSTQPDLPNQPTAPHSAGCTPTCSARPGGTAHADSR